jgi:hypothetical protein
MKGKIVLSFFYCLAFFLSIQVQKPSIDQTDINHSHTYSIKQIINLLPIQEQNSKIITEPVNLFPVIIMQGFNQLSSLFLRTQSATTLFRSYNIENDPPVDIRIILFRNLRI